MKRLTLVIILCILAAALIGCDAGPVVVVATPVPPDSTFLTYRHPTGVFSLRMPANWSVRDVSRDNAVRVEFSPPGNQGLPLTVYVINTGTVIDAPTLLSSIDTYQAAVNGNPNVYTEVGRNAQGDGSWRVTGVRQTPIGARQLNTFVQADKSFLSVLEMDITDLDGKAMDTLRAVINTYRVNPNANILASSLGNTDVGVTTSSGVLTFDSLFTWTNSQGVFIINGRVTNTSGKPMEAVRVSALLYDAQNNQVSEQGNVVPIEVLLDGQTTPFTVQFKDGKPSQVVRYELQAAGRTAEYALKTHLGDDQFIRGNEKATFNTSGYLTIGGDVVNRTQGAAHFVKATITLYDDQQRVVAMDSVFISKTDLLPGESAPFEVTFPETGGGAIRFEVTIEGKSDG